MFPVEVNGKINVNNNKYCVFMTHFIYLMMFFKIVTSLEKKPNLRFLQFYFTRFETETI
jgi:hypothetical protein